jgi:ankyrin repeat protein
MYPNPQEALPLPSRPNLEQYKKLAKDLVKACRSGDSAAIRAWTVHWLESLAEHQDASDRQRWRTEIKNSADQVEQFARTKLSDGSDRSTKCTLTDAQFVIARAHGFSSWPAFSRHLDSLAVASSPVSAFESGVQAVVSGDRSTLERLLRERPELVRAQSAREHKATLLHYVSANGVEGYHQVSPKNAAEIARVLLDAGAEVDAGADVYGSTMCTTLGLVATSGPPAVAGVQLEVIDVLLEHGARTDLRGMAGHNDTLIRACLANGQPAAAEHLVSRGAALDFVEAAGLGRVDVMEGFSDEHGQLNARVTPAQTLEAFAFACAYGRTAAAGFLLDRGVAVDAELKGHGEGHTGLHVAAYHGHADLVSALLRRGARVDAIDKTWRTPPLLWALTGWSRRSAGKVQRYYDVVTQLRQAGAIVRPDLLEWEKVREDPKMQAALTGKV